MKVLLTLVTILYMLGMTTSTPEEDRKKADGRKIQFSQMYYSLDVSEPDSEIKEICISDQKQIDGDIYRDITVRPGITVNEIFNGNEEIWKSKPNRELVKLVVMKMKDNYIYIIITKDRSNRLAETHLVITKVSMTFNLFKDLDYPLINCLTNEQDSRSKNLRMEDPQNKQIENEKLNSKQGLKAPFQSKEYMNDLLPTFVTRPKFREMDSEENK